MRAPPAMLKRALEAQGHRRSSRSRDRGASRARGTSRPWSLTTAARSTADLVVVAVGIRANVDLARTAGLDVNRGIVVDDGLQTSLAGIHAIGECAEHRGVCYGLVEPAYEQARVLARRLAGDAPRRYAGQRARDQSQGLGRQRVLGRRFPGRAGHRGRSCSPIPASTPTRSSSSPTAGWSARCSSAIPRTASGTST